MAKTLDEVLQDFVDWGTGWKTKAQAEQTRADSLESGLTDAQSALAAERASDAETDAEQAAQIRAEAADAAQRVLDEAKAADVPAPPAEEPPAVPGDVTPGDATPGDGGTTTPAEPAEPADPLDPEVPVVPVDSSADPVPSDSLPGDTPVVEVPEDTTTPVEVPSDAPVVPAETLPEGTPVVPVEAAPSEGGSTAPADTSIGQLPADGGDLSGIPGAGTVIGDVSQTGPAVDNPLGEPVDPSGTGQ